MKPLYLLFFTLPIFFFSCGSEPVAKAESDSKVSINTAKVHDVNDLFWAFRSRNKSIETPNCRMKYGRIIVPEIAEQILHIDAKQLKRDGLYLRAKGASVIRTDNDSAQFFIYGVFRGDSIQRLNVRGMHHGDFVDEWTMIDYRRTPGLKHDYYLDGDLVRVLLQIDDSTGRQSFRHCHVDGSFSRFDILPDSIVVKDPENWMFARDSVVIFNDYASRLYIDTNGRQHELRGRYLNAFGDHREAWPFVLIEMAPNDFFPEPYAILDLTEHAYYHWRYAPGKLEASVSYQIDTVQGAYQSYATEVLGERRLLSERVFYEQY